jgi:hypothetical protein
MHMSLIFFYVCLHIFSLTTVTSLLTVLINMKVFCFNLKGVTHSFQQDFIV